MVVDRKTDRSLLFGGPGAYLALDEHGGLCWGSGEPLEHASVATGWAVRIGVYGRESVDHELGGAVSVAEGEEGQRLRDFAIRGFMISHPVHLTDGPGRGGPRLTALEGANL